jgi:glycosyltransferase involved in cell wall biosynthesis
MATPLRILMICPQFRPIVGGYERAAERLSAELGRLGHNVTVLAERRDRNWLADEQMTAYAVHRVWCVYRRGWHIWTSLLSYALFIVWNVRKYDVCHVHQYGHHAALLIAIGGLFGRPVVLKVTNTGEQGIESALHRAGSWSRLLGRLHRQVNACVVTTGSAFAEAVRFGIPANRIQQIPNGVDLDEFAPATGEEKALIKTRLGLQRALVVIYCGRLTSEKNPDGLLEAWRIVAQDVGNVELVLVGDGPLRPLLENSVRNSHHSDSVRLVGIQSQVVSWYRAADVYVLPSRNEGLSNSLLEAMSCGLPVVSTRVSGSTEIFSEADIGCLVDVGDVAGFADALKTLLTEEKRRLQCGVAARSYVKAKYSIESVGASTVALYQELLSTGGES